MNALITTVYVERAGPGKANGSAKSALKQCRGESGVRRSLV